jgi:Tir chaperone family protein CesT
MLKLKAALITAIVLLMSLPLCDTVHAQDTKVSIETIARVVRLLEGSEYQYSKLTQTAWSIKFRGNNKDSVEVLIVPDRDDLILLSVIADHSLLDNNATALRQLLKANAALPESVSVMMDSDDDYIVQTRNPLTQLTVATFKAALLSVASGADDIYGTVTTSGVARSSRSLTGTGTAAFNAPRGATQEIEVLNGKAAVSITPNIWKETKSAEAGRRTFLHANGDGYGMIIAERIEISTDQLREVALNNAREAAPDMKIVEEHQRRVNGIDVVMLRLEGKTNGIAFTYLGYYYGGPAGTVQVITYTGQNLFQEYRSDFEDFLNGFHLKFPAVGTAPVKAEAASARQSSAIVTDGHSVRVSAVDLGRSVTADKTIGDRTDIFSAGDTIYTSIITEGSSSSVTLRVRWTYQDGQLVDESTRTIAPAGKATTEFHISKPDGLPTGRYKVELFLDRAGAGEKHFEVR